MPVNTCWKQTSVRCFFPFRPRHRWGYFPSFSAAWRISEESFMENTRGWLNSLKLRGSWGMLGNQDALSDGTPTGGDFIPG